MSRAICIPFHRYQPHFGDFWRVYFDNLVNTLGKGLPHIDKLYVLDSDCGFDEKDKARLEKSGVETVILPKTQEGHHWVQFRLALPEIKEDYCLFMDNDIYFKTCQPIFEWFEAAEKVDIVTAFDNSGSATIAAAIWAKYPGFAEYESARMGSYYFIANRRVMRLMAETELGPIYFDGITKIKEIDHTPKKGHFVDSFGLLTIKLLAAGMKFGYIEDWRHSIHLEKDGEITRDPGQDCNYYHVRNGNLPVYLLTNYHFDQKEALDRCLKITPRREWLRLMAWFRLMSGDKWIKEINEFLAYAKVKIEDWDRYYQQFLDYYAL